MIGWQVVMYLREMLQPRTIKHVMFQFVYLAEKMLKAMFALDCGSVRVI